MILALLAQTILVVFGYTAALFAAGSFAAVAVARVAGDFAGDPYAFIDFTVLAMTLSFQALLQSIVPSILAITLTEFLRLRHLATHLLIGCAVGLLTVLPIDAAISGYPALPLDGSVMRLAIAAGAVGAFFYWLIAGRTAGRWLEIGNLADERR